MGGAFLPTVSKLIYKVFLSGVLYTCGAMVRISLIIRITQKNNTALVRPKIPLVKKDFAKLYLPYILAIAAISSIKIKKAINIRTPLSFNSFRRPPIKK